MKKAVAIKIIPIVLATVAILCVASTPLFAQLQPQNYNVMSGSLDGELKSKGSEYGAYDIYDGKAINRGALGGGTRGYEWVTNSSKSPGKRGALGAIDGQPDAGGKGNTFTTTITTDSIRVGQLYSSDYEIFKGYLSFDTTGIPSGSVITGATLTICCKDKTNIDTGKNFDIRVYKSKWTEPLWNPDWGAIDGATVHGSVNTADLTKDQECVIILDQANGLALNDLIEKGKTTQIVLISSRTAAGNLPPEPLSPEYVEIYSANAQDPNKRPRLDIQYNGEEPNIKASLTWTGEQYYKMNTVYPQEIFVGENNLIFRVQYTHILGTAPVKTQVWIDLNADGDFDTEEQINMRPVDYNDTDYTNGKLYYADVTLNSDGITDIHYRFVFTDDSDVEAIGTPALVASLTPIQAEEKNICFIDTAQNKDSVSSIVSFIEKRPLIYNLFSSLANQKVMVHISF